ncbi:Putative peptidyl-tRNA hydrolase PTRHD1 [Linum grandiflorum]
MATQLLLFSPCRLTTGTAASTFPRLFSAKHKTRATHFTLPLLRSLRSKSMSSGAPQLDSDPAKNDVLVQYVVLRRDLIDTWPTGSVVTQGCHAAVAAIWSSKDDDQTLRYCGPDNIDSMHKVTLEVKGETQMLNLAEKLRNGGIAHKLWIEQPENIPTSIATKPYPKSQVASFFKKLKLCK